MSRPLPRESAHRCALQAQLRGDPMTGTAPPAQRLLLVEQPGPWGPRGLLDSRCEPRVAERIDQLGAAMGMRLQAIRHPGRHADHPTDSHRVAVADVTAGRLWWWTVPHLHHLLQQLEDVDGDLDALLAATTAEPSEQPTFFVCTHGRHDACCALRGRPLVDALVAVAPDRTWETTHVGGDRFAANLLVLPTGELYGRVLPFAAPDLVAHADRGEVVPGLLRGRVGLVPIAQAALVHAHAELGLARRDDLTVLGATRLDDQRAEVRLATPDGDVVVDLAMGWSDPNRLTCGGPPGARNRTYRGVGVRTG